MKTLPLRLAVISFALFCFCLPDVRGEESAQQLAEEQTGGSPYGTDSTGETAGELADKQIGSMSSDGTGESASDLAGERGINPGTGDSEESAQQLADQTGGSIPADGNLESAQDLENARQGITPTPTPSGSGGRSVFGGGGVNGTVYAAAAQSDGRVVIAGEFNSVDSVPRSNLARLNADGSLDQTFLAKRTDGLNGTAYAVAIDSQGGILVGGEFSQAQEQEVYNFARYADDGTLDTKFNQGRGPNGQVLAIAVQPDGKVVIGGEFSQVGSEPRRNVARFDADGKLDTAMVGDVTGRVRSLAVLPDGAVVAGGDFEVAGSTTRSILRSDP